jgi:hypothetical protein
VVAWQQWHSSLGLAGVSGSRATEFDLAFVAWFFLFSDGFALGVCIHPTQWFGG